MPTSLHSPFPRPARLALIDKGAAWFGAAVLLAISAATVQVASAQTATGTTGIDSTGSARSEMASCNNGTTQQARDTCLTEVRNANAEKRAGKLGNGADYSANALQRCQAFQQPDEQAACKARVMDAQNVQGGVARGGVLRQTETVVPAAR